MGNYDWALLGSYIIVLIIVRAFIELPVEPYCVGIYSKIMCIAMSINLQTN